MQTIYGPVTKRGRRKTRSASLEDQTWGLPRLFDGQPELQKPPAFYWLVAATAEIRGETVDAWAVRLPCAIAGLLTVSMIWLWLALQGRPLAGFIAGLTLATAVHFTMLARTGRIDMTLTTMITASVLLFEQSPRTKWIWLLRTLLASFSIAFAILLKGPIGAVLPAAVMGSWSLVQRWRGVPFNKSAIASVGVATALGAGLALPWFLWVNRATNGEFFRVFFWYHNVQRAVGDAPNLAVYPWWYYLPRFAVDFLPWTPLLLVFCWRFARNRDARQDQQAWFGLVWLVTVLGVLSLASFKRADYLLPAFPGAALFLGCLAESWLQQLGATSRRWATASFVIVVGGCLCGWWWFHHQVEPRQQAVREQRAFPEHIRQQAPCPRQILLFRVESHLLAFHLGRPVHTLVEWGELNQRLAEPGPHWFVTRAEFVPECLANVRTRPIEVETRSELFTPAPPLRPLVLMRTTDETKPCPTAIPKD